MGRSSWTSVSAVAAVTSPPTRAGAAPSGSALNACSSCAIIFFPSKFPTKATVTLPPTKSLR
jgi:hypothetical protein